MPGSATDAPDRPLQEQIAATLEQMIRSREIQPGQLMLEVRVAQAFGVSRSPARLALQLLDDKRLLRRNRGRGYQVAGRAGAAAGTMAELADVLAVLPKRRAARVYVDIEREVATRVLFRSVRIVEERVALHFGVSRTMARDVMTRLAGTGLVEKDGAGHWQAVCVTAERVRDLYQLRWALEPEALASAGSRIDPALAAGMVESLRRARANLAAFGSHESDRLEADLHVTLLAFCPNRELLHALRTTHLLLISSHAMLDEHLPIDRGLASCAIDEHLEVMDAVVARRPRAAAAALRRHLRNSVEPWLSRFHAMQSRAEPDRPPYVVEPAPTVPARAWSG